MKHHFTTLLILLSTFLVAQNKNTEKADQYFASYQYVQAIQEYQKLVENKKADYYIYNQLAECYYNLFNPTETAKWFEKSINSKTNAESYYKYAQTLKILGKYKEANAQMNQFSKMMPNDERAIQHLKNPNYIPNLSNKSSKLFDLKEISFKNEGQNNFGATLTDENVLYFASNKNNSIKKDNWTNQPYLDIFKMNRDENGNFSEAIAVNELNTAFHDGPVTISKDGNTMFFARDSHSEGKYQKDKSGKVKIGQQGLYKATKTNGKWSNIEALPINSTEYSVTNPSLSADGKTLYFASNMPGGLGASDIWKISIDENSYGKPTNLGKKVNTSDRDNFPFITDDEILYFSSTGRNGMGGLDIFKIDLKNQMNAENIGTPVNSEKDDFSFSFNKKHNIAFFSSNRNGDDAFLSAIPKCYSNLDILVLNSKNNEIISNANISILDFQGNNLSQLSTSNDGKANCNVNCNATYSLVAKAANFETESINIEKTIAGVKNIIIKLSPTEVIITDKEVILNNVYFEYNKSNITEQGANELDKLVKVMNENQSLKINVKSHTDSNGLADYNMKLSERRAQSTVQYIISKGISLDRISGKGYGSSEPKIDCKENCTEDDHSKNRRSEFIIIK